MTDIRDMELLSALAVHGHFARAAEACGISQPAFSARIRNLELSLGVPIVKRGNRFLGFTAEGEIALKWAHRIVSDADGLTQEVAAAKGALSGTLTLGAVPTALTFAARAPGLLHGGHPGLLVQLFSATSAEIRRGLEDFSMDAGITYLDVPLAAGTRAVPLYDERYELLCPEAMAPRAAEISWAEAARLPLCLLTRNMRNRKIVDDAFAAAGAAPRLAMETNAFTAVLAHVATGAAAAILPHVLADSLAMPAGARRLALTDPVVEKPIGIVTSDLEPGLPAVRALIEVLVPGRARPR